MARTGESPCCWKRRVGPRLDGARGCCGAALELETGVTGDGSSGDAGAGVHGTVSAPRKLGALNVAFVRLSWTLTTTPLLAPAEAGLCTAFTGVCRAAEVGLTALRMRLDSSSVS